MTECSVREMIERQLPVMPTVRELLAAMVGEVPGQHPAEPTLSDVIVGDTTELPFLLAERPRGES
ncbi:hypothetical protein [Nocardia brasiliensis]|uniref:hypothetical protein n=1 Tax=Nocardia brasiliensis TaxID=37326 RepID=UPI0033D5E7A5